MRKRSLWLGLILIASFMAEGCCWCNRPHLIRRWWNGGCCAPACGTSYFGAPGCCDVGGPIAVESHAIPPLAPGAPMSNPQMPGAAPLTRARFANR